jgi:DNA modification methylase
MTEVPVIELAHLSKEQRKALIIADNKLALNSDWDTNLLAIELKDLQDLGFDLNLTGFDGDELANLLKPEQVDGLTDENSVPEIPEKPKTKPGDIYILGNHRLMCGDSTSIDAIESLMNGEMAQISFTSPPYNAGDEVEIGTKGQKYETHNDNMVGSDYLTLLKDFTTNTLMFSEISIVNIQQLAGNKIQFIDYLHTFKHKLIDICIWNKTHGTPCLPKKVMNSAFEYVLFFSNKENPAKTITTAPMFHGNVNNIYHGDKQTSNEYSQIHRATFPIHLPEYFIKTFSTGNVLELFNGTGTTLIACEKLNRKCYAMDMDPLYIDVTIKRWQEFTGQKAVLESTNQLFDELNDL